MNFEEAKKALRDGYLKAGFQLVSESGLELSFNPPASSTKLNLWITKEEINEYAEFEDIRSDFKILPTECGICSSNYREQIIDSLVAKTQNPPIRLPRSRLSNFVFGNKDSDEIYVEIDEASMSFINFFRFEEAYLQISIDRINRNAIFMDKRRKQKLQDVLYRPLTIKVYNLHKTSTETALDASIPIVDACLFELPYLKNVVITLQEEWPRKQPKIAPFRYDELNSGNELPLRHVQYNSDTIRFYQRGMNSTDPVNAYLSFYQILEYFFVSISDEQLYSKLARYINDPKLSATPTNLDRIIQEVTEHKGETDETEMLKNVFTKFIDETDLIDFIRSYEKYLGDNLYTKKRVLFGVELEAKLVSGHTSGNIAKRIKTIRNALVHSSDRYERKERYIPSLQAENLIRLEIPLLKFIAEKVIVSSAK